ncbi:MAG TPA: hypothetical protein VG797_04510 [Phycisphaerales bacterium]|nr:hypothetical protein [Phycisphaerales bacterium]
MSLLASCAPAFRPELAVDYPTNAKRIAQVDVQVYRLDTEIEVTNTSAQDLSGTRMWLNQDYSLAIAEFPIGRTLVIPLDSFHNEYGEPFRAGGFFAIDPPSNMVKAEIETPEGMIELIAINGIVERNWMSAERRQGQQRSR